MIFKVNIRKNLWKKSSDTIIKSNLGATENYAIINIV